MTEALLVLLALAATYVIGELSARLWLRVTKANYVWRPNTTSRLLIDREAMPLLSEVADLRFNTDGERGDPLPTDWRDTARVLVLGGSIAECYFLDQDASWPAVIQRVLNEPGNPERLGARNVYVGNIGRSLLTCEYMTRLLSDTIHRYERLDVIVIMCGGSDMVSWMEKGAPAHIERGNFPLRLMFDEHANGPFGWSPRRTAMRRDVEHAVNRVRLPVKERSDAGKTMPKLRAMRAEAKHWIDEVPDPTPLVGYFEDNLRRLVQIAQNRAKRVLIARQPWFEKEYTEEERAQFWNFGVGRPHERVLDTYYTHRVVHALMRELDAAQLRVAQDLGAEQIHLMPLLEPSLETFYDTLHFRPAGADVVGRAIAEALLEGQEGEVPRSSVEPKGLVRNRPLTAARG